MPWLISYVVTPGFIARGNTLFSQLEQFSPLGHASIAVSEIHESELPKIIFRIGLFSNSKVLLEDFVQPCAGREFYHKTYPISKKELEHLLLEINRQRHSANTGSNIKFNWLTNNCKSNALYLLKIAGIEDEAIRDLFIDTPTLSSLEKFKFNIIKNSNILEWATRPTVTPRDNTDTFTQEELRELESSNKHPLKPRAMLMCSS